MRDWKDEEIDPDTERYYGRIVCRICSRYSSERTATHLTSSCYWDFFRCSNCGNWFQVAEGRREIAYTVHDKRIISALNFSVSSDDFVVMKEGTDFVLSLLRRSGKLVSRLITYLLEN
ncbi:MAG TPA: hypothetical protein VJN71_11540 [Nitrososphaerales archaeon]|nr:hypothetical protein [Nitrososphaerales archaeon]